MPRLRSLLLVLPFIALLPAQTQPTAEQVIDHIQDRILPPVLVRGEAPATTKLADRMAALHVPGVSIAVIRGGKIEWARGFGVARIGGPAVTPDTLFQAASISKPVSAMAVLHLVQEGKLDLDADVDQYLKSWKVPSNNFTAEKKVTLRELLTHTAGMTVHGFPGYASGEPLPTPLQILNGEKPANSPPIRVDTEPGKIWRYSGGGYVVAQLLLQDVTGQPFPKLMHDTVLAPIGMTRSTYEQPLPASRMAEVATPYRSDGQPVAGGPHVYPEMAPAGLWTTPSDLARYAIEVQKSLAGASNHVLSAATTRRMLTPGLNRQGLGPGIGGGPQHPYFTHGGANEGYRCDLVAYNEGDGVAIMTNGDNGGQLFDDILSTLAHDYNWPDFQPKERTVAAVDAKTLDAYLGAYRYASGVMTITRESDQLFEQRGTQPKVPIFPEGQGKFFEKTTDATLAFDLGADGKAAAVTVHQNEMTQTARRVDDAEAKRIAGQAAAAAQRFKDQKPAPGSEAALRRNIDALIAGQPLYDEMSSALANVTRQQLPELKTTMAQLGALQSITFKGVGPGGADIYEVKFEKGSLDYRVWISPDGKTVERANMRKM